MEVKIRREHLLEELDYRLRTLQKELKSSFGIARLKDGAVMSCAFVSCFNCVNFDEINCTCKTRELLELTSLIVTLSASIEEYIEIEVEGE